mgnify:CR=1 FL=1
MSTEFKKTLILPLISTGNVPQLSTDIILHSLSNEFKFIKSLDSTYVHPFVGALDYSIEDGRAILYESDPNRKISTALELFYNESKNLYIIQQRTPVIQGYMNNFIKEVIIPLIQDLKVTDITILDSFGALDESIITHKFNSNPNGNIDPYYSMGICKLEGIGSLSNEFDSILNLKTDPNSSMHYTNSLLQFTERSLLQEISTDQQIFKIIFHLINSQLNDLNIVKYCSFFVHEGDNSLDARLFISHFNDFVNPLTSKDVSIENVKIPISWKGVYGFNEVPSSMDEGIYI